MRRVPKLISTLCLFATCIAAPVVAGATPLPEDAAANTDQRTTRILDQGAAELLRGAQGMTLQWISWDWRGDVEIMHNGGLMTLKGEQDAAKGPAATGDLGKGRVTIDGVIIEIGADYFLFDGEVTISDSPDMGRECRRSGPMLFRITQNRQYWRMQNMEQCDGLTDYVDIYF